MELIGTRAGQRSERINLVMRAANHAILSGSVMVGAIGLGRGGLGGFLLMFLAAVFVSALLIYLLLLAVIFPLVLRRPDADALTVSLCSMAALPVMVFVALAVIFGAFPDVGTAMVTLPLFFAVVYGALLGGHLRRLEKIQESADNKPRD